MAHNWTPVYSTKGQQRPTMDKGAMATRIATSVRAAIHSDEETARAVEALILSIPGFDVTVEVDIAGKHRITVHFQGASISIDE